MIRPPPPQRPPRTLSARYLLELTPSQKERWQAAAQKHGVSFGRWIRDGIELVERANEDPDETVLGLLRELIRRTRGKRRVRYLEALGTLSDPHER